MEIPGHEYLRLAVKINRMSDFNEKTQENLTILIPFDSQYPVTFGSNCFPE